MKKLTVRKLDELRIAIDEWASSWKLGTRYVIYMNGGQYAHGELVRSVNPSDYCEGWGDGFIFGMAIDGAVYEAIHVLESYYYDARQELDELFKKYGLGIDFYDSTHLTAYSLDEEW